ncbi:polyamine aminopropyltransferase [Selenomonadales bacterium OttesenSCG-928-I06]|nr:polyamine aminopropyltransferase [Selenomonadales bacterium OttesenSCG-928-I06]
MELWINEIQTNNLHFSIRAKDILFAGNSQYQEIILADTDEFGYLLILDNVLQTCAFDEFIYHEMITHIPVFTHPNPKKVLIVGGGDGGTAREVLRHLDIEEIKMVEIDKLVIDVCKKYIPEHSSALINEPNEPRFILEICDGFKYLKETTNYYDIIIVDCSDPIGPGEGLFSKDFYKAIYKALKPDGLFVQQTESPFYYQKLIKRLYSDLEDIFPITRIFLASIPLYQGCLHSFTIGSKKYDPLDFENIFKRVPTDFKFKYYNKEIHQNAFSLPNFFKKILKE